MTDEVSAPMTEGSGQSVITELISYRLSRVSNALSRSAGLRYRRGYGVSLAEWRTLALLGAEPNLTVNKLARRAGLDKAQMSRVVSGLSDRGLVAKSLGPRRATHLSLTEHGTETYEGLIGEANDRDRRLKRHLGPRDLRAFERALDTLDALARVMEEEEQQLDEEKGEGATSTLP